LQLAQLLERVFAGFAPQGLQAGDRDKLRAQITGDGKAISATVDTYDPCLFLLLEWASLAAPTVTAARAPTRIK
jgi:hypothetical protein